MYYSHYASRNVLLRLLMVTGTALLVVWCRCCRWLVQGEEHRGKEPQ